MALTKKSLNNFLPNGFETQNQKGYKANFTADRILTGYDKDTLEVLSGPNLNNLIDVTGKNFNTLNDLLKYFNDMPIDSFPIVNASNQLDYKSINSFFRNVGELVFSAVPIDDKNLKLLDGAILDGAGTYRVFVSFISKMVEKFPNLFLTENEWQAQVNKYGVCGKFVWDAVKNTLRIPKVSGIIEATLDPSSIGNVVEAGLPNITGSVRQISESYLYSGTADGAFAKVDAGWSAGTPRHTDGTAAGSVDFNAARSNATYGKSNTVQPQTIKQYIYMVVSVDTEETQKLTSVFQYRGSVPTFADLPKEGNLTGDVWNVDDTDINYVWDGQEWDQLSGTVDLTGYYTKDECDLKFAEQTSLASNVEKLQGQITQNKTDISIISSGKTIESAVEQMKGSKFLENKGTVGTYANVYNDIEKYYHSTFDKSKFEIVGNPNISDNGIASGFTNFSYVATDMPDLSSSSNWTVITPTFKISAGDMDGKEHYVLNNLSRINNKNDGIIVTNVKDALRIGIFTQEEQFAPFIKNLLIQEETYQAKLEYINGEYIGSYKNVKDTKWKEIFKRKSVSRVSTPETNMRLGWFANSTFCFKGSLNIKEFSMSVNGAEVFNGNKTGIDIIKPDNFTKVGNPVISDDGVASGFSLGNVIKPQIVFNPNSSTWEINIKFTTNNNFNGVQSPMMLYRSINNQIIWQITNNGDCFANLYDTSSQLITSLNFGNLETNTTYNLSLKFNGLEYISYVNNIKYRTFQSNSIINTTTDGAIGSTLSGGYSFNGSIDLNAFKIYVDGNLVYQPMLRIPYHETIQGFKIAPAEARTRVVGMGQDYGYSQYFTIDEDNKNYTLPCGANPSGRQDLISSFDDGTNKVEQFSDLTVKQSGNCTANQPVVLMKPYRDDKYKISVPYSSKTKTGFTPTQSGNWFAEGKIYLD